MKKVYRELAQLVDAYHRCIETKNTVWEDNHRARIEAIVKNVMPSGSGFDSGTQLDFERSSGDKLVFNTAFHHMNENGFYDGWTEHTVTVKANMIHEITLTISGRNRNQIKDYIHECFDCALTQSIGPNETVTDEMNKMAEAYQRQQKELLEAKQTHDID